MTLTTETIVSEAALRALEPEWRELWADALQPSPFQRFEWVEMCWRRVALHHPGTPRLVLVREDGRLVLAGAMLRRRRFRVFNEMANLATTLPQYDGVLMRRGADHGQWLRAFAVEACRHPLTLRICFDRVPTHSALAEASNDGGRRSVYGIATLARLPKGFAAYWATRGKSLRSDHRRQLRRMQEDGGMDFRLSDASTLDGDLDWLLEKKRAWQPREGRLRRWLGLQAAENDLRSYCHAALAVGGLCLGMLSIGGRRAGGILCFAANDQAVCYLIAQDLDFENLSPGRSAMILTFEAAAARGITLLDFMGGASDWKARLGTETAPIERLRLRRPG